MIGDVVHVFHNGRWFVGRVAKEVLGHHGLFEVSFVNPDPADGRCLGAIFRPDEIKEGPVVVSELAGALKYNGDPVLREYEWRRYSACWNVPVGDENIKLMIASVRRNRNHNSVEADILIGILREHARAAGIDVSVAV